MVTERTKVPLNDLARWEQGEVAKVSELITSVLNSGSFLNSEQVRLLEEQFERFVPQTYSLGVSNGSAALYIALQALGISESDEIVTVGVAGGYSTNAILRCGATPSLIDVESSTGQMSIESLEQAMTSSRKIKGVVMTHLYGLVGDVATVARLCRQSETLLIEDCAQSFGAEFGGRRAGSWGDAAAFSFYPTKNLAALGDGGMVTFKNPAALARARKIAQYGWSSRYEVECPGGINSRLDEIQAAVVLHRLNSVDSRNARRREILRRYADSVSAPRRFIFEDSERCVAHLAVMRTPSRESDEARLRDAGIETSIHYPIPDHHQPAWRHLFEGVELPNTEAHCREVLTLPCFPELTEDEITRVCQALREL
jgi:dTDP-4-amino-4,6-dideoxygalactose transaminase